MYLLGYDIGSSSIKAALVEANTGSTVGITQFPDTEMEIISLRAGWAEQHPESWWDNLVQATRKLLQSTNVNPLDIKGVGIAYQMHGLVLVDQDQEVLRPSIIWCDSRAIEIGNQAFMDLGSNTCLPHLLNSPGNFTASKLKWVKDNEPEVYDKIYKFMLPGDYIAMKLTGDICTTISGLSEGMFWDFEKDQIAGFVMDHYGLETGMVPDIVGTFSNQGVLSEEASALLGLEAGIPIGYRAGDQPNNALSLNVLNSGEVAATGGTSGVVYGVVDQPVYDQEMRVNGFAHVNYTVENPSIGILLCINGAGIQYGWMKQHIGGDRINYQEMERMAAEVPVNSDGLRVIPFGNGAERMLGNRNIGSHLMNLQLNRHGDGHLFRAALEGIAYSFSYGIEVLKEMGLSVDVMKVGNDNLFQSAVFSNTLANLVQSEIQVVDTTGAVGAAKAAGIAVGAYASLEDALGETRAISSFEPDGQRDLQVQGYTRWKSDLESLMDTE